MPLFPAGAADETAPTAHNRPHPAACGQPLDDLVLAWGPPQSSYTLRDGRQVVEYQRQQLVRLPGRSMLTTPRVFYLLDEMEDDYTLLQCRTRFTVDAQGIIQNWTWDGNACRE